MKLRYYLRGLGIGMVVTALIMGSSSKGSRPLTDAEIKAKAAALGMVESDSLKLSDVAYTPQPAEETIATPEPTEKPTATPDATEEPTATPEATEAPTATPEVTEKPTATPDATEKPTATPEPTESSDDRTTVTVIVKSGSGSGTVCRQLEEAGLIKNAAVFDQYLIDNGYSKKICVGTFEIKQGTTEEEIAKIITKTR